MMVDQTATVTDALDLQAALSRGRPIQRWMLTAVWLVLIVASGWAVLQSLALPSCLASYCILAAYALCLVSALVLGGLAFTQRLSAVALTRSMLVIVVSVLAAYLWSSITFSAATFLAQSVLIVLSSIALLLTSPSTLGDGPREPVWTLAADLFGSSKRARKIQSVAAGVSAALVPLIGLLYSNVYAPSLVPPELVLTSSIEPGGTANGLREVLVRATFKNSSSTSVRLLATVINVTGTRTVPAMARTDGDYNGDITRMAAQVRARTRASDPLPNATRGAAMRFAASGEQTQVYALEDFVESAVLQPDGESESSHVFWIADGAYDALSMSTAVSYARESDVLDAVVVSYRADGSTIHIAERVRKLTREQDLSTYDDFALLRIGGYTVYNSVPLWGTPRTASAST